MVQVAMETFQTAKSGKVSGIIYMRIGEEAFPEKEWNDFPIIILNWWLEKSIIDTEGVYSFMDGPFSFKIFKKLELYAVEGYHKDKVVVSGGINIDDFRKGLLKIAKEILRKYKADNLYFNTDIEIRKLKSLVKVYSQ